jgi:2TM domain
MSTTSDELRRIARKRIEDRRGFIPHALVYVLVNAALVAIWATNGQGFFWPGFVIGFWGIGLVMHAWSAFYSRPITEADVQREIDRIQRGAA